MCVVVFPACMAFLFPGVYVQGRLFLVTAIVAVDPEEPTPLGTSWALTRGRTLHALSVLVLISIPWFLGVLLNFVLMRITPDRTVAALVSGVTSLSGGLWPIASLLLYRAYAPQSVEAMHAAGAPAPQEAADITRGRFE